MLYPILLLTGLGGLVVMALLGFLHGGHHHGHGHGHGGDGHGHGIDVDLHGMHGHGAHGPGAPAHGAPAHGGHGNAAHGGHAHTAPVNGAHGHGGTHSHGHAGTGGRGLPGHAHGGDQQAADGDADSSIGGGAGLTLLMWLMPLTSPLNWFSWMVGAGAVGTLVSRAGGAPLVAALAALVGALAFQMGLVKPIWNVIFRFASRPAGNLEGCLLQEVEAATAFNERGEGLVRVLIDGREEDVLARLTPEARALGARVSRGQKLLIEEVDPHTNSCRVSRA